jgi:hypothetical protein
MILDRVARLGFSAVKAHKHLALRFGFHCCVVVSEITRGDYLQLGKQPRWRRCLDPRTRATRECRTPTRRPSAPSSGAPSPSPPTPSPALTTGSSATTCSSESPSLSSTSLASEHVPGGGFSVSRCLFQLFSYVANCCSWHDLAMVHENHHMKRALKQGKPYEFKVSVDLSRVLGSRVFVGFRLCLGGFMITLNFSVVIQFLRRELGFPSIRQIICGWLLAVE